LAKNCALIAVSEIIQHNPSLPSSWDGNLQDDIKEAIKEWEKVKSELDKM